MIAESRNRETNKCGHCRATATNELVTTDKLHHLLQESRDINTFTTQRETCPPVHTNNVQPPQEEEEVKYLGLQLDRRLT
jgi:hypothetical protein